VVDTKKTPFETTLRPLSVLWHTVLVNAGLEIIILEEAAR
jgi:hypothetical protein